jgi:cellobiose-specific phosphotransferase system component IIA
MFESIVAAWGSTMQVATKVLDRIWGSQTSQESSLMKRAEHAATEYHAARARLIAANAREDLQETTQAVSELNKWRSELNRLKDEAAAKRS